VTEEIVDLPSDSDEEKTDVLHGSPNSTKLKKTSNKIVQLCSLVFIVEIEKRVVDHPLRRSSCHTVNALRNKYSLENLLERRVLISSVLERS
jgi:hypothetical protein